MSRCSLVWFRADLRITDNPALFAAGQQGARQIIGLFTICPKQWAEHDWSDARVDLLLRSLSSLQTSLAKLGIPLLIETQPTFAAVPKHILELCKRYHVDQVYINQEYEINEKHRDQSVRKLLKAHGIALHATHDQVVLKPGDVLTQQDRPYTVFTPYKNAWLRQVQDLLPLHLWPLPKKQSWPTGVEKAEVPQRLPHFMGTKQHAPDWDVLWPAGEEAAHARLHSFLAERIARYDDARNLPAEKATSALSPYLALGVISPRQCLHAILQAEGEHFSRFSQGATTWCSQLVWRDFYRHLLDAFPRLSKNRPFHLKTERLTWADDEALFKAWTQGKTGFPLVDAGMRQLQMTGWMHNRVRMVVASLFTKNLWLDWRRGEKWFMQHLIDGDLANNNGGWQWAASTGNDAAPYFRIFNPFSQSQRFDPTGAYIKTYVGELRDAPAAVLHQRKKLAQYLVDSKSPYPTAIVDLATSAHHAKQAFAAL